MKRRIIPGLLALICLPVASAQSQHLPRLEDRLRQPSLIGSRHLQLSGMSAKRTAACVSVTRRTRSTTPQTTHSSYDVFLRLEVLMPLHSRKELKHEVTP